MKFSQFYFPPEEYVTDNVKMRIRLGSYVHSLSFWSDVGNYSLGRKIQQEEGIDIPSYYAKDGSFVYNLETLFRQIEIKVLLNIISVVFVALSDWKKKKEYVDFVNRCFAEEGLAYIVNVDGTVRFRPDQEFERNRISTLKSLVGSDVVAVLDAFNNAFNEFQSDINKSKSSLRYIFEANEIMFKKLSKPQFNFDQLNSGNIEKMKNHVMTDVISHLDDTAKNATNKFFEAYKKWTDGMHPYRHGQDTESYENPPVDITIFALSNGASYLRLLASLHETKKSKKNAKSE